MGLFNNIKKMFSKKEDKEIEKYENGLTKTKDDFVNKINVLGFKYTKIDDKLFDELEEILIMSDIGVKTSLDLTEKLRKRVKEENITDFNYLKEVLVDELLLIYINGEIISSKINFNEDGKSKFYFLV